MKHPAPLIAALVALALPGLAGCSPAGDQPSEEEPRATAAPLPQPSPETAATLAPPKPLVPGELALAEWRALDLEGELGCAFAREAGGAPLFFATGIIGMDSPAEAALKLGDKPVKLVMDRPGGFDALAKGGRFTGGDGVFAEVTVTGDEPLPETPQIAMESPQYRATLSVGSAGRSLAIDGIWECGP